MSYSNKKKFNEKGKKSQFITTTWKVEGGAKREIKGSLNELIFKTGRLLMMIYFVNW